MNIAQRVVLVAVASAAVSMMLYPPFHMRGANGIEINSGYALLFDPPTLGGRVALVHAPTLFVQLAALLIAGGAAFMLVGGLTPGKRRGSSEPKFDPARAAEARRDADSRPSPPR